MCFSPIVIILIIMTVLSVFFGLRQAKHIRAEGDVPSTGKRAPMIFLLAIIGFIGFSLWDSYTIPDYARTDRVFPLFVASVSLIGALILLIQMIFASQTHSLFADREHAGDDQTATYGLWPTLSWFAFLLGLSALVGFIIALAIFLISFLRIRAGLNWIQTIAYSLCGIVFMMFMAWLLNRDFPAGLLQAYFDLPWPFT